MSDTVMPTKDFRQVVKNKLEEGVNAIDIAFALGCQSGQKVIDYAIGRSVPSQSLRSKGPLIASLTR